MNLLKRINSLIAIQNRMIDNKFKSWSMDESLMAVACVDKWIKAGSKTFVLSKHLAEAFKYTDIPLDFGIDDFCMPFDCFLIESEIPLFQVKTKLGIYPIMCMIYYKCNITNMSHVIGFYPISLHKHITGEHWLSNYDSDVCETVTIRLNLKDKFIQYANMKKNIEYAMTPEEYKNFINMFFNTVLYINDPERNKKETEITKSRKTIGLSGLSKSSQYIYLKPHSGYVPISKQLNNGCYKIDKRFIVHGHWRKQRFGPKNSMQKLKKNSTVLERPCLV